MLVLSMSNTLTRRRSRGRVVAGSDFPARPPLSRQGEGGKSECGRQLRACYRQTGEVDIVRDVRGGREDIRNDR